MNEFATSKLDNAGKAAIPVEVVNQPTVNHVCHQAPSHRSGLSEWVVSVLLAVMIGFCLGGFTGDTIAKWDARSAALQQKALEQYDCGVVVYYHPKGPLNVDVRIGIVLVQTPTDVVVKDAQDGNREKISRSQIVGKVNESQASVEQAGLLPSLGGGGVREPAAKLEDGGGSLRDRVHRKGGSQVQEAELSVSTDGPDALSGGVHRPGVPVSGR